MGNKREPSSVNKPQTEMLEQVLACGTPQLISRNRFCALVKTLDLRYTIPNQKHLAQVCLSHLYYKCRAKVLEEIHDVTYYAATTDM